MSYVGLGIGCMLASFHAYGREPAIHDVLSMTSVLSLAGYGNMVCRPTQMLYCCLSSLLNPGIEGRRAGPSRRLPLSPP